LAVLTGVRVLAVEQYGAGPFGTQALADLGAEVIKIENPRDGGDVSRGLGPYFDARLGETAESLFFQSLNRNKKSVALDLGAPEGYEAFCALARGADALACNLRGDVPERLGLTHAHMKKVNPALVCCFLTAYGRDGTRAAWPGYDYLVQAETGYFSLNGDPDAQPARFGLSVVDFMTGQSMALALVAGVLQARQTGLGQDLDVCLYDVGLTNTNYLAAWALNAGHQASRQPRSGHPTLVPCQLFRTQDGWIYIMANKEKFFPALCEELEVPELARDPRFRRFSDRLVHRAELSEALDAAFMARPTAAWLDRLAGIVPAAAVQDLEATLESGFTRERRMITRLTADSGAQVDVVGSPFRGNGTATTCEAAPPLGRDTDTMLRAAGYDSARIDALRARGILA